MTSEKSIKRQKLDYICPKCGRDLTRINKRKVDKAINMFLPVRRFKCLGCFWEGLRRDTE